MPPPYCPADTEVEKKIYESEEVVSIDGSFILDMAGMLDASIGQVDNDSFPQSDCPFNTSITESKACVETLINSPEISENIEITENHIEYSLIGKTEIDLDSVESLTRSEICRIESVEGDLNAAKEKAAEHVRETISYDIETYASQIKDESDEEPDVAEHYTSAEMEMYPHKDMEFKKENGEIAEVKSEADVIADTPNPSISLVKRQCSDCGYKCWTNAQFRKHKCTRRSQPPETNEQKEASDECVVTPGRRPVGDKCRSKVFSPRSRPLCSRAVKRIYASKSLKKSARSSKSIEVTQSSDKTKFRKSKLAKALGASKSKKISPAKIENVVKIKKFKQKSPSAESHFQCSQCHFATKRARVLVRHEATHDNPTLYKCHCCEFSCTSVDQLNIHSTSHEPFKSFTCSECPYTVRYIWMLYQHRLMQHANSHVCKFCNSKFTTELRLAEHVQSNHSDNTFSCKYCSFTTPSAEGLRRHARTRHSDRTVQAPKRFKCSQCPFSSHHASGLYGHVVRHSGVHPYRCTVCEYTCPMHSQLKRHLLVHTQERPYKCELCDFASNTKYNLKLHNMVHTREKPHKCHICDFSTNRSTSLKVHMLTHTKEKKFSCSSCNFTCSHYSSMRRHRTAHMRSKRHCCPDCTYFCKQLSSYLRHRATMHGVLGGYSCTLCAFVCDRAWQLARHRNVRHGEGGPCVVGGRNRSKHVDKIIYAPIKTEVDKTMCTPLKTGASMEKKTGKDVDRTALGGSAKRIRNGASKKKCTPIKTGASREKRNGGELNRSAVRGSAKKVKNHVSEENYTPVETGASAEEKMDMGSLLDLKVVCRRLTISEIIHGRLNS